MLFNYSSFIAYILYLSPDSNWDFTGFKAVFSANWNREASLISNE